MNVLLRSDDEPDVRVYEGLTDYCDEAKLEQHIRTLRVALAWLKKEKALKKARET